MNFFTVIGAIIVLFIGEFVVLSVFGTLFHKIFWKKEMRDGKLTDRDIYCAFAIVIFLLNLILALIIVTPNTFGLQKIPTVSENSISENNIK